MRSSDLTGQRFGRLLVQNREGSDKHGNALWLCLCDCGNVVTKSACHLKDGRTLSCKCLLRENSQRMGQANLKHGHAIGGKPSSEYRAWEGLLQRCFNSNDSHYSGYGGRGITVCDRWNPEKGGSFQNFFADLGPKPGETFSIDRKQVNGNYEPKNCRWATKSVQSHNQRKYVAVPHEIWEAVELAVSLNSITPLLAFKESF